MTDNCQRNNGFNTWDFSYTEPAEKWKKVTMTIFQWRYYNNKNKLSYKVSSFRTGVKLIVDSNHLDSVKEWVNKLCDKLDAAVTSANKLAFSHNYTEEQLRNLLKANYLELPEGCKFKK